MDVLGVHVKDVEYETGGCTPAPERPSVTDGLEALLVTVTLPVALPADAGAKTTFSETLCPGARVCPAGPPLTLKPGPEMLTFVMLALAVPLFESVAARALLPGMVTLPRLRLAGVRTSVPTAVGVVVPLVEVLPVEVLPLVVPPVEVLPVVLPVVVPPLVVPPLVVPLPVVLLVTAGVTGTGGGATTLSVAMELVTLPAKFPTTTVYCEPVFAVVVGGVL